MAMGEQAVGESPEELLSISPLEDGKGLEIFDHIERRHFRIETRTPIESCECTVDRFEFPVERAVTIETDRIDIPNQLGVVVRNSLGFMVDEISTGESRHFPRDGYSLDPGAPIKTYVDFESSFSMNVSNDGARIELDSVSDVHIGFRSHHKQPAASITTTGEIPDLMEAVSYFGSALKTTSCERSYPSLRGHPPLLEVGSELEIPPVLEKPKTGIRIEIPEDIDYLFGVSSLAYYMGADVVPSDEPRITTDQGFVHDLYSGRGNVFDEIDRTLKQVFFLDCITRTEGFFQVYLHERSQVEERVDLDFEALYHEPITVQLSEYLSVPHEVIESEIPKWKLTAHVSQRDEYIEALPFLANDIARIKPTGDQTSQEEVSSGTSLNQAVRGGAVTRSTTESAPTPSTIRVGNDDSMEQAWFGKGAPVDASKAMLEAFYNQIGRKPSDGDIDITVVCNASEMGEEGSLVNEVYGSREELPFDVAVFNELTVQELRTVIEGETDFLHYIGHIDGGGFECTDGRLDVWTIESTGVESFFLNACTSYDQGRALIKAGSIGGVVTLEDVINSGAQRVGKSLARLLNCGFPLRPALDIAKSQSIMGGHYLVVGDGSVDVAQPRVGFQGLCELEEAPHGWNLRYRSFPSGNRCMGSIITPNIESCEDYYLISGEARFDYISADILEKFLSIEDMPILYRNELSWSMGFL